MITVKPKHDNELVCAHQPWPIVITVDLIRSIHQASDSISVQNCNLPVKDFSSDTS